MTRSESVFLFLMRSLEFADDLRRHIRGNDFVTGELHFKCAAALRHRAQLCRIFGELCERNLRLQNLHTILGVHADDASALMIQMPRDIPHELRRRIDFHRHYRLLQHRIRLFHRLAERLAGRDLERHFRRVDIVEFSVVNRDFHVFHDASGKRTALHRLNDAFLNRGNEVLRNSTADNGICKFKPLLGRLNAEINFRELPVSAGLLFMPVMALASAVDGLAVRNLRRGNIDLHLGELFQSAQSNLQMQSPCSARCGGWDRIRRASGDHS